MAKKTETPKEPSSISKDYQKLIETATNALPDIQKTCENCNRAAGRRARKALQDISNLAKQLRKDITEHTKKD